MPMPERISRSFRYIASPSYRREKRITSLETQLASPPTQQQIEKERGRMDQDDFLGHAMGFVQYQQKVIVYSDEQVIDHLLTRTREELERLKNHTEKTPRQLPTIDPVNLSTLNGMVSFGQFNPEDLKRE